MVWLLVIVLNSGEITEIVQYSEKLCESALIRVKKRNKNIAYSDCILEE